MKTSSSRKGRLVDERLGRVCGWGLGGGGGVVGLFTSAKCHAWSETVTWGIMNAWNHSFAHRSPFIFSWMVGGPMTETLALMRNYDSSCWAFYSGSSAGWSFGSYEGSHSFNAPPFMGGMTEAVLSKMQASTVPPLAYAWRTRFMANQGPELRSVTRNLVI